MSLKIVEIQGQVLYCLLRDCWTKLGVMAGQTRGGGWVGQTSVPTSPAMNKWAGLASVGTDVRLLQSADVTSCK